ncbi:hypothetical protein PTTG_27991 [Puccinia triticina 1-1 BBBD Race 1]|uniref:Uncharacterized protein n=1 Tax=Puccinia triticina (isolate 1-1 / race 1 (BBBD)) TaxID=630390 RepID=A0A180GHJ4_PUCT1|nr:hypothetical protein PTTG_27991 [Puccinia triticina 1-1 BBBD Race 1]
MTQRLERFVVGPDAEDRKTDRCSTRQWLSGGAFDERLDSAFRHKYISREEILSNLLKKFGKIENEPPQDLSDEMKSDLDEALRILFLTQNGKDPETPIQIAHYFQVFCQMSGVRHQERSKLNQLILTHIEGQLESMSRSGSLSKDCQYLYNSMKKILHARPPKIPGNNSGINSLTSSKPEGTAERKSGRVSPPSNSQKTVAVTGSFGSSTNWRRARVKKFISIS